MEHDKNSTQGDDDEWLTVRTQTMDQFKAHLDAEGGSAGDGEEASQEMIEAGWEALDCEGLDCPPVETMQALWRAMYAARPR